MNIVYEDTWTLKNFGLNLKDFEFCMGAYELLKNAVPNKWERVSAKRSVTRPFYMLCKSLKHRYVTAEANKLPSSKICWDHWSSPQTMCHFICDFWYLYENNVPRFVKMWKLCSTVIGVTSKQNDELKGFTDNIDGVIRVYARIEERYDILEYILLDRKMGLSIDEFPYSEDLKEASDGKFFKYQEEVLLLDKTL